MQGGGRDVAGMGETGNDIQGQRHQRRKTDAAVAVDTGALLVAAETVAVD